MSTSSNRSAIPSLHELALQEEVNSLTRLAADGAHSQSSTSMLTDSRIRVFWRATCCGVFLNRPRL